MKTMKPLRLLGAATLLSASALAAVAQTTPPAPSSPPAEKPPMAKPEPAPAPQTAPTPAPQTSPKVTTAPNAAHPMVGKSTLSSDGNKVSDVRAVKTGPDGKVTAIQIKVGGFLGFGGKIVEVPDGKFTQKGDTIQLGYTSEELSKLPEIKDAS
jgi:PRC-barrel domain